MSDSRFTREREGERGAALVMVLLIGFLLMVVGGGLLMEVTTNTANVTDITSEQQAYYAAESGIQAAVNVLRDNVTLSDENRIDPTKPVTDKANRIDYLKALNISDSNLAAGVDVNDSVPRLSRWLKYNVIYPDRIGLGDEFYHPNKGYAFKLEISDPDNTGSDVEFSTTGRFFTPDPTSISLANYGTLTNGYSVQYVPQTSTRVNTAGGAASTSFGTFRVTKHGAGALISSFNRFEIVISMTLPYAGTRVIRGYLTSNVCVLGLCTNPQIIFDSRTFTLQGSKITLTTVGRNSLASLLLDGPPAGFPALLDWASALGSSEDNPINATISSPEPLRLLIKSTGFGPRGSKKQLEAIIRKNFFNGISGPGTLTLVGPPSTTACPACVPAQPATGFVFNPGSSNVADYSGQDEASTDIIPPVATTNGSTLDAVSDSVDGLPPHPFNGDVVGVPSDVSNEITSTHWLYSPPSVDASVKSFYPLARDSGRYFASGTQPTSFGDNATGTGLTFCDGNCTFTGTGGGILIVTGTLTLHGSFSFRGMIVVTGKGGVTRQGAGNGEILGNLIVAPYVNGSVLPSSEPVGISFLAPQYDLSGGGNSSISYSSSAVGSGLLAVDNFVLGVVEK